MKTQEKTLEAAFNDWARTRDITTAFGDALEMLVCEFTPHRVNPDTKRLEGRYTDKYLEVAKRYKPDHIREYYPPLCRALFAAYDQGVTAEGAWCDPLGAYFQEIASNRDKSWKGQFFTPPSLCNMMAQLTLQGNPPQREQRVLDPACGSGRMQIAFDRNNPPHSNHFYVGVDIDARCIRIAAINFYFHGMRGAVICGNSLSLETRFGFYIHHPLSGLGIEHLDASACERFLLTSKPEESEKNTHQPGQQLQLF